MAIRVESSLVLRKKLIGTRKWRPVPIITLLLLLLLLRIVAREELLLVVYIVV